MVLELVGFEKDEEAKLNKAASYINTIWMSDVFRQAVFNAKFTQTADDSSAVYSNLMRGMASPSAPLVVRISKNLKANGSETASTNTVTGDMTLQAWYVAKSDVFTLVNTIAHEITHGPRLGSYRHSYLYNRWVPYLRSRPWSVSYQIGDITEKLARGLFKE